MGPEVRARLMEQHKGGLMPVRIPRGGPERGLNGALGGFGFPGAERVGAYGPGMGQGLGAPQVPGPHQLWGPGPAQHGYSGLPSPRFGPLAILCGRTAPFGRQGDGPMPGSNSCPLPDLSRDLSNYLRLARQLSDVPDVSMQRSLHQGMGRDLPPIPDQFRERSLHPGMGRDLLPLPDQSRERSPHRGLARDLPPLPDLSRERSLYRVPGRDLLSYPDLSRPRSPYRGQARDRSPHHKLSRERSPRWDRARDLSPYPDLPRGLSPRRKMTRDQSPHLDVDLRRSSQNMQYGRRRSPHTGAVHDGWRSPVGLERGRSQSPYSSLSRNRSPLGFRKRRSRSPYSSPHRNHLPLKAHSPLKRVRRTRSRSPVSRLTRPRSPYEPSGRRNSHSPLRAGRKLSTTMQPDKKTQLKKSYAVKVSNVPPGTVYRTLWAQFKQYGAVNYVELNHEDCSALVYFATLEDRENAIVCAERFPDNGMKVKAWEGGSAEFPVDEISVNHPKASRTLLVGNLDKTVSRKDLRAVFQAFGKIVDVEIKRLPRAARYYAILQYTTVHSVCEAILRLDGTTLGEYKIRLSFGVTQPSKCVVVRGLPKDLQNERIIDRFKRYGTVDKVVYDNLNGAALVLFKLFTEAEKAVHDIGTVNKRDNISIDYADDHFQLHFCRVMQAKGQDTGDFLFL